jgi:hypothetical protein
MNGNPEEGQRRAQVRAQAPRPQSQGRGIGGGDMRRTPFGPSARRGGTAIHADSSVKADESTLWIGLVL